MGFFRNTLLLGDQAMKRGLCLILVPLLSASCLAPGVATGSRNFEAAQLQQLSSEAAIVQEEDQAPLLSAVDQLGEAVSQVCGLIGMFGIPCSPEGASEAASLPQEPGSLPNNSFNTPGLEDSTAGSGSGAVPNPPEIVADPVRPKPPIGVFAPGFSLPPKPPIVEEPFPKPQIGELFASPQVKSPPTTFKLPSLPLAAPSLGPTKQPVIKNGPSIPAKPVLPSRSPRGGGIVPVPRR